MAIPRPHSATRIEAFTMSMSSGAFRFLDELGDDEVLG